MGRHAWMIMAHDNFDFLKDLMSAIDDTRNDIYLHVDIKAEEFAPEILDGVLSSSGLYITERTDVRWGGFSQVACELILLEAAASKRYDYCHLLSGSDYPLKSQDEIHAFFEEHAGDEFIAFDQDIPPRTRERVSLWHFFRESRCPAAEPADHALTLIQRALHVDRLRNKDIILGKGPNWFSITGGFARYVLEHRKWIESFCSHSVCADEIFLQTLILNSPYRGHIFDEAGVTGSMANLRYVDWERGSENSPYVFQEEDRDMLMAQPHMLARKFTRNILDIPSSKC